MPIDLFIGKSSVQTAVYVFRVGEAHKKDDTVRFIDFSNDGYTRANRKKAKCSCNLRNTDHATERYQEVVDLVQFGRKKLHYFTQNEFIEDTIDPNSGKDWNFEQHQKIDTNPTEQDFMNTVKDYLAWKVSCVLKAEGEENANF